MVYTAHSYYCFANMNQSNSYFLVNCSPTYSYGNGGPTLYHQTWKFKRKP